MAAGAKGAAKNGIAHHKSERSPLIEGQSLRFSAHLYWLRPWYVSTGCGSWYVPLFARTLNVPYCRAYAQPSVPAEPMQVSMPPRSLPAAAQFLLPGNERETAWLPIGIS